MRVLVLKMTNFCFFYSFGYIFLKFIVTLYLFLPHYFNFLVFKNWTDYFVVVVIISIWLE